MDEAEERELCSSADELVRKLGHYFLRHRGGTLYQGENCS